MPLVLAHLFDIDREQVLTFLEFLLCLSEFFCKGIDLRLPALDGCLGLLDFLNGPKDSLVKFFVVVFDLVFQNLNCWFN